MMKTTNKLGIWMDHANAHLMVFTTDPIETKTIESSFTHETKEASFEKSESLMHNKEQHEQLKYYKDLGNVIKEYSEVVLFGPTDAKTELYNILKADTHFEKIIISVRQTDKMTENQQHVNRQHKVD